MQLSICQDSLPLTRPCPTSQTVSLCLFLADHHVWPTHFQRFLSLLLRLCVEFLRRRVSLAVSESMGYANDFSYSFSHLSADSNAPCVLACVRPVCDFPSPLVSSGCLVALSTGKFNVSEPFRGFLMVSRYSRVILNALRPLSATSLGHLSMVLHLWQVSLRLLGCLQLFLSCSHHPDTSLSSLDVSNQPLRAYLVPSNQLRSLIIAVAHSSYLANV